MKKIYLSLFSILLATSVFSQLRFDEIFDIKVTKNGSEMAAPFNGGFNAVQFGEIDLNFDGVNDLIVYDRFGGFVKPYINNNISDSISYTYAPELA